MEMIGPLVHSEPTDLDDLVKSPAIAMFSDMEIKLHKGPLFVGQNYRLEKEVIGLGESPRTESVWVKCSIVDAESDELVATTVLNVGYLKQSYANYEAEAVAIGKAS